MKNLTSLLLVISFFVSAWTAHANPVIYWNNEVINTTRLSRNPAPVAGVHLATFNVAVYDVVNIFDRRY